jgi:hypothetical protein
VKLWHSATSIALASTGCGYQVSGKGDVLPKRLHTIAIPVFGNITVRYKPDRNDARASWFWIVADNFRISADNAVEVAREALA